MGDVFSIFLLCLLAMFNPTLLAAVTIMMLLPEPKRLITGYLLGAYLTSIGLGLAIVFSFHQSSGVESSKKTLSPLEDLVFGAILAIVGWALLSGRVAQLKESRRRRKEAKHGPAEHKESLPEKLLGRGSMRITFAVGALLSLPGASYFVALDKIGKLGWPTVTTGLAVVIFCLIQQLLLELPAGRLLAGAGPDRPRRRPLPRVDREERRPGGRLRRPHPRLPPDHQGPGLPDRRLSRRGASARDPPQLLRPPERDEGRPVDHRDPTLLHRDLRPGEPPDLGARRHGGAARAERCSAGDEARRPGERCGAGGAMRSQLVPHSGTNCERAINRRGAGAPWAARGRQGWIRRPPRSRPSSSRRSPR